MKTHLIRIVCILFAGGISHADDISADNLSIGNSAYIGGTINIIGQADFNTWSYFHQGARFDANTEINTLSVPNTASFGSLFTGLQSNASYEGSAFYISTSQALQPVQVPYTVDGYYQDTYVTVEEYGTIYSGYWQATYDYGIVSGQTYPAVTDSEGNVISAEWNDYQYGYTYTGDTWIDSSYWGVTGSHTEPGQVWVDAYQSSYTDYQYDVPKIQFTAARSNSNWAWQVPTENGGIKDIMLLWNGGLRLPSDDTNRMMALMSDSLTQSYHTPLTNGEEKWESSELKMDSLKTSSQVTRTGSSGVINEKSQSQLRPESIQFSREEQTSGNSITVQTQIAAKSASFGGVVQVEGDMKVRGVLRVLPAGDLEMGEYTNGVQP